MTRGLAWLLVMVGTMLWAESAAAQGRKPKLPAGFDPGGVAIAILSSGIDYRAADIAQRLARDGEGDLIGWDLVDRDNRPFNGAAAETPAALGGDANALIRAIGQPGRRVVPVRIDARDPVSLARAASFVAQTPARIVVVPMWTGSADQWATFGTAIKAFPDLLFIVAAGDEGRDIDEEPNWPAAFGLANVLVVTAPLSRATESRTAPNGGDKTVDALVSATRQLLGPGGEPIRPPDTTRLAAVLAADALAGCWPQLVAAHKGAALKQALLAEAAKAWPNASKPIIERCIDGGAAPR
jgi:hypothetical protein